MDVHCWVASLAICGKKWNSVGEKRFWWRYHWFFWGLEQQTDLQLAEGEDCLISYSLKTLLAHQTCIGGRQHPGRQKCAGTQAFAHKGTREMANSALTNTRASLSARQLTANGAPQTLHYQVSVLRQTLLFLPYSWGTCGYCNFCMISVEVLAYSRL